MAEVHTSDCQKDFMSTRLSYPLEAVEGEDEAHARKTVQYRQIQVRVVELSQVIVHDAAPQPPSTSALYCTVYQQHSRSSMRAVHKRLDPAIDLLHLPPLRLRPLLLRLHPTLDDSRDVY
jgi:hypothetical protein